MKDKMTKVNKGRPVLGRESWRSFQTAGKPLTDGSVVSFGISEGNITRKKNKIKQTTIEYAPNYNSQWRSSPDAHIRHQ